MTLQEILFIVAIVFFVLAGIFIVTAVVVFFVRNIPDVQADLSGKKRAAAVAEIAAQRPGRDRRKGVARVEPTSGTLDSGSLGSSPLDNPLYQVPHVESVVTPAPAVQAQPVVSEPPQATFQPQPSYQVSSSADDAPSDDSETVILPDDDSSTTILGAEKTAAPAVVEDERPSVEILSEPEPAAEPEPEFVPVPAAEEPEPESEPEPAVAAAAEEAAPVPDDAATTILPSDDSATTILPEEAAPATPEGFVIVRKIILRESTELITAG